MQRDTRWHSEITDITENRKIVEIKQDAKEKLKQNNIQKIVCSCHTYTQWEYWSF